MQTIVTPLGGISAKAGGRTRAVLNRNNLLGAFYRSIVVVLSAKPSTRKDVSELRNAGRIESFVEIIDLAELLDSFEFAERIISTANLASPDLTRDAEDRSKKRDGFSRTVTPNYIYEDYWNRNNVLTVRKENLNKRGFVTPYDRVEYRINGIVYTWRNFASFCSRVIECCLDASEPTTIFSDVVDLDNIVEDVNGPRVRRIGQFHGQSIARIGTAPTMDHWVTLTQAQADLLRKRHPDKIVDIIPNPILLAGAQSQGRDKNLVVSMGHLSSHKRVEATISAIAVARELLPNIRLEIYGQGDQKDELIEHARSLGLENHVHFMGFTTDPAAVFRRASAFSFTSRGEGLPFVVAESLSLGCPVVSYDIKYGPSEMIVSGENGWLVKENDVATLGKRLAQVLTDPPDPARMTSLAESLRKKLSPLNFQHSMSRLIQKSHQEISNRTSAIE